MSAAEKTKESSKHFSEQPLNSLGQFIPIGMVIASVTGFVVAFIQFVVDKGYSGQFAKLKDFAPDQLLDDFTLGTANLLVSGVVPGVVSVLFFAEIVILMISYYKTESTAKKVASTVCLVIAVIIFGIAGFTLGVLSGRINLSEQVTIRIIELLAVMEMKQTTVVIGLAIAAVAGIAAFVVFIILMSRSEHGWMLKNSAIALLICFIIIPLVLLAVENIFPLIMVIIFIVLFGVIIRFLNFLADNVELSDSVEDKYSGSSFDRNELKGSEQKTKVYQEEKSNQKVIDDWSAPFWKDQTWWGNDYIYCKDWWEPDGKRRLCTVYEFEKGEVAIIDHKTKKRVMNIAGCKFPEK